MRTETPSCPRCGSRMTIQRAQLGPRAGTPFWFCVRAEGCGGSLPFDEPVLAEHSA